MITNSQQHLATERGTRRMFKGQLTSHTIGLQPWNPRHTINCSFTAGDVLTGFTIATCRPYSQVSAFHIAVEYLLKEAIEQVKYSNRESSEQACDSAYENSFFSKQL